MAGVAEKEMRETEGATGGFGPGADGWESCGREEGKARSRMACGERRNAGNQGSKPMLFPGNTPYHQGNPLNGIRLLSNRFAFCLVTRTQHFVNFLRYRFFLLTFFSLVSSIEYSTRFIIAS